MDPLRTSTPVPISSLHERLNYLAHRPTSTDRTAFLAASNPQDITLRCARNIINSLQRSSELAPGRPIDPISAQYAALWALIFLNPAANQRLPNQNFFLLMELFAESFPHDASLVEKYILPLVRPLGVNHAGTCHRVRWADLVAPEQVKRRIGDSDAGDVKFGIGQVFRHKRYHYVAVVTGWDAKCNADDEWIRNMGVDYLDGGRRQPFYHALWVSSALVSLPFT
jgi:F-box protein 21